MSKAEELLERWLKNSPSDIDLFIYRDTRNYLNRKDKLVVGSKWVCDVDCYHRYGEHDSGNIVLVSRLMGGDVGYYNSREDFCEMPLEQFLVCFSPVEKENV